MAILGLGPVTSNRANIVFVFSDNTSYAASGVSSTNITRAKARALTYSQDESYYIFNDTGATEADTMTFNLTLVHNDLLLRLKQSYINQELLSVTIADKSNSGYVKRIEGMLSVDVFQTDIPDGDDATWVITISGKVSEAIPTYKQPGT